jgi:uncharacterized protein (DUF849 family)
MSPFVAVALNGARSTNEHPGIPRSPEELAREAQASVTAGARILHLHVYDPSGTETFAPEPCARTMRTVRAACPGIPVSLTTSATIEPEPKRRMELIAAWTELPDLVTANQGEKGIVELCEHLIGRRVGIEAGLLSLDDAYAFIRSGLADRCARVLVEPLDQDPETAIAHAATMEDALLTADIQLEQIHHGDGIASWAVCKRAVSRGYSIRTGLEDTTVMPDGHLAVDNAELVRVAVEMFASL